MAEHKFKLTKQLCELAFKSWNLIVVQSWNASNQFKRVKYVNVHKISFIRKSKHAASFAWRDSRRINILIWIVSCVISEYIFKLECWNNHEIFIMAINNI